MSPKDQEENNKKREVTVIDASDGGTAATGDGARAIRVEDGGKYIEKQVVEQETPVQPGFYVPFAKHRHFVGREDLLEKIHSYLDTIDRQPVGLLGMGGIGKTQLAAEYAYRHQDNYPGGVFWLNAADAHAWQERIAALTFRAGGRVPQPERSDTQLRYVQLLVSYLNQHPNTLLVMDNVNVPSDLTQERVQGFIASTLQCRVLFTTRRKESSLPFEYLDIGSLSEDESLDLLLRHESRRYILNSDHPEHPTARQLCARLAYLPLMLEMAGAFLNRRLRVTVTDYLQRVGREGVLETLETADLRPEDLPTGHDPSLMTTLLLSWQALEDEDTRHVLQIAALLGEAESIPRARLSLLTGLSDEAELGYSPPLDDALATLRDYSLVEELTDAEVRLHPLVCEFIDTQIHDRAALGLDAGYALAKALWDPARLEIEIISRSVDAVLEDLRIAVAFHPGKGSFASTSTPSKIGSRELLRTLDREAHSLRIWNHDDEPAFFLQQWRNLCFHKGWNKPKMQAEKLLSNRDLTYLREQWQVEQENKWLLRKLVGHNYCVYSLAFSPNGQLLASGSADKTIKFWDVNTGQQLNTLSGHTSEIDNLVFSKNGNVLVSCSRNGRLRFWNTNNGQLLQTKNLDVKYLVKCPNIDLIAVLSEQEYKNENWQTGYAFSLRLIDIESMSVIQTIEEGKTTRTRGRIRNIVFSPDGHKLIYSASKGDIRIGANIYIWDVETGKKIRQLEMKSNIHSINVSPDGLFLGISFSQGYVELLDMTTGHLLDSMEPVKRGLQSELIFSPDGKVFVVGTNHPGKIRIWDMEKRSFIYAFEDFMKLVISKMTFSPSGQILAVMAWNQVKLINVRTGDIEVLGSHTIPLESIVFSPSGNLLASSQTTHGNVLLWDTSWVSRYE